MDRNPSGDRGRCIHLYQRTRTGCPVDVRLLGKVADELARLQEEKALSEFMAHRSFIVQLAKAYHAEERVTRRRTVREFTYKQSILAERIIRELEETKRLTQRGTTT